MKLKLLISFTVFFVSLVATAWWLINTEAFLQFDHSRVKTTVIVIGLLFSVFVFIADAFRYKILLDGLDEKKNYAISLESSIINFFFAWTTPGAVLAAPMTAYFMVRRNISFESAVLASFGKSVLGTFYLLLLSLIFIFYSGIYKSFDGRISYSIMWSFFLAISFIFFTIFVSLNKQILIRLSFLPVKIINVINKLHQLLGVRSLYNFSWISVSQIVYFVTLMGLSSFVLSDFLKTDLIILFALSSLFISLIYLSPTPGGIGLGEVLGIPILGRFMPETDALMATILIRFFIVYLPIIVGAAYLFIYHVYYSLFLGKE